MTDVVINNYYNFDVVGASILGSSYRRVKLVSILDYETAKKFSSVDYIQQQIIPYLLPGVSRNITKYTFYLFKHKGKDLVVAKEWIRDITMETSNSNKYYLTLENVSTTTLTTLTTQLNILGINYKLEEIG